MTEFEEFKREFTTYQDLFGLSGYRVYFKHEDEDMGESSIVIDTENMIAEVCLNKTPPKNSEGNILLCAKHEAIHLLLGRLMNRAYARHVTQTEIYEATEEVVNKLEDLIP